MHRKQTKRHHLRAVISEWLRTNWQAVGLLTVTGMFMIGAVAFAWQAAGEEVGTDGCPNRTPRHVVGLYDGTSTLSPLAVSAVQLRLSALSKNLRAQVRLSLYGFVSPTQGLVANEFSGCIRKLPTDAHWLTDNKD